MKEGGEKRGQRVWQSVGGPEKMEVNNPAAELRGIKNQKLTVLGADT